MQNINEVIGIIKGISFDGIINDQEIDFLKLWQKNNRHFALNANEHKLIKLIDEALDDKILTDLERRTILTTAQSVLKSQNDENTIYSELNGIIEGIISDDEVNKEEILNLYKWWELHSNNLHKNNNEVKIKNALNDILQDGIITIEEQDYLLNLLKDKIGTLKLDSKIEYLKKLIKGKNNIGIELIDLLDSNNNMDYIHNMAQIQLKNALNSYSGLSIKDPEIVVISLSLIAMLEYDGAFYESVRKKYKSLYSMISEQKIEGLIRTVLNRYRTREDKSTRSRIINVPLRQSIVPKYYLANFFDFIFDIYKINFEYVLSSELYDDFQFVYDGLKSNMQSEGDTLEVKITQKTYKLIQTTKDLVTKENNFDPLIKLSIIIVQLIDKYIWNNDIYLHNIYLREGFEKWSKSIEKKEFAKKTRENSHWKSRWQPKFYLYNNSIVLAPPIHKVKSIYNYWDIKIIIKNNDKVIYVNNNPDIREIIGGYQISIPYIQIDNPLGKLRYFVMSKNEVIYDSKELLYRDFLVFDQEGKEIKNNTDYKGTAIFCTKKKILNTIQYLVCNDYILSTSSVKYGDVYFIENKIFNFTSLIKPGIFGEEYFNHTIVKIGSRHEFPVYKKIKYLVFEDEGLRCKYEIIINDKIYQLNYFHYTITSREGINKYVVDLDLNEANIYIISVNKVEISKRTHICTFNVALDPNLITFLTKIDDIKYNVHIETSLISNEIEKSIDLDCFDIDDIQFKKNSNIYAYRIPFDLEIYRISNDTWKPINNYIWINDIKEGSVLDVYGLDAEGILVCSSKGNILEEFLPLRNKGIYKRVSIGFLRSYKNLYDYVSIFFLKDNKAFQMIRCYNKCIIEDNDIETLFDSVNNKLSIKTHFKGKGSIVYEILDNDQNRIYRSIPMKNNEVITIQQLDSFKKYTINIFEKSTGLMLGNKTLLKTINRTFYARKDLVNRAFRIIEAYYYAKDGTKLVEKKLNLNKNYIKITKQIDDNSFIGQIYLKTAKGIHFLDNINPVEIEINSDVISGTMDLYITNDGDGLLIDLNKKRIMNDLEDYKAPCIETYTIDVNGGEKM